MTLDVVRSLLVAQEIPELSTRLVLIIHHTDCGAQAAVRHHHLLMEKVNYYMTHTILPIRCSMVCQPVISHISASCQPVSSQLTVTLYIGDLAGCSRVDSLVDS